MLPVVFTTTYPYYTRVSYLPQIRALSYMPISTLAHPLNYTSFSDFQSYLNAERLAALDLKHEIEDRIAEYNRHRIEHRLMHDTCSKCKITNETGTCTDLTIDEKIRALREELNLPPERSTSANYKYCACDHREYVTPDRPKVLMPRSASRKRQDKCC